MLGRFIATVIILFLFSCMHARAADADRVACDRGFHGGTDWDNQIAGCTRLLARGARLNSAMRSAVYSQRGYLFYVRNQCDSAIADASEAIRLNPTGSAAYATRGECLRQKGDHDGALADASKAIALAQDHPGAMAFFTRGLEFYRMKDFDESIADLSKAQQLAPTWTAVLDERSRAYAGKGDFASELADAEAEVRLQPRSVQALGRRAGARLHRKEYDLAMADCEEALRLNPNDPEALNRRAWTRFKTGDFARAIDDATEALRFRKGYAEALDTRAQAYLLKGDVEPALADANDAVMAVPNNAVLLATRAQANVRKHDFDNALADVEAALKIDPKRAQAYEIRALALEGKGDLARALADINQALALETDSDNIAKYKQEQDRLRVAFLAAAPPALAAHPPKGRRVALIVAEQAYSGAPLTNPRFDAGLIKASLEQAGFEVAEKDDVDLDAFEQALTDFAGSAKGAEVALFYFAGHGFSLAAGGRQQNLLMSTSANFNAKTMLTLQGGGEPLEHVEEIIVGRARATLIFIDACRNVPVLASRSVSARGFAPIDTSSFEGAYVVLSTRQGKTAEDGAGGQGSPFARAFAAVLPTPGLRIEDAYYRIREKVRAETSGEQVPDVIRSDLPEGGVVLMEAAKP